MAFEIEDDKSTLTFDLRLLAKHELQEDDLVRKEALGEMRSWIHKNHKDKGIQNCRQDANFLLRFLRHKKFNVPLAQETLVRYLSMRQDHPKWFQRASLHDPVVLDIINQGVMFPLPQRDLDGRRVIFSVGGNIDPTKHKAEDVLRAVMVCFESLLEDEENQIRGFSYILDESGITTSHLTSLWHPSEFMKLLTATDKGLPMRHRSIAFMRLPFLVNAAFTFAKNLMPQKLQKRIVVLKHDADLKKIVDTSILPKEYGGTVPMQDMIEMFKDEIREKQERLLALDDMKIDVKLMTMPSTPSTKKTKSKCASPLAGIFGGFFRKVEVD